VSWDHVCLPKQEGGLGLKRVEDWNKAIVMKHIWNLFTQVGSLWVAWVHCELLKGRSFWIVKIPQDCTWGWRKLLNLRPVARNLLSYEIGDGSSIFLWHDCWHPNGVLYQLYGHRIVLDVASSLCAKVSSVFQNKEWCWRLARSDDLVEVQSKLSLIHLKESDRAIWNQNISGKFTITDTWQHLRMKQTEVQWWKLLWFPTTILKHSFIGWLAIKNRLATKNRLLQWGIGVDPLCKFYSYQMEDREHLFFQCSFTNRIWKVIMALCLVSNAPTDWNLLIDWGILHLKGKSFRASLCKVAWWATVYHLWLQRNSRIHGGVIKTEEQIVRDIQKDVKARLDSVIVKTSVLNRTLCNNWKLKLCNV
jgi:hypothetical protein